jgi:prophage maintenance system killer protein
MMKNIHDEMVLEKSGKIVIYQDKDRAVALEVKLVQGSVWLTQAQLAGLFLTDRTVITRHLGNIFSSGELEEESNVQKMHIAHSDKPVKYYSLDAIISVGYRVNSKRATQFRIWATNVLKRHLVEGYTLNGQRLKASADKLKALQKAIKLIGSVKELKDLERREALGLLEVIQGYSRALELLDDYDRGRVALFHKGTEGKFVLTYAESLKVIRQLKKKFGGSGLFGLEKDGSFKSSIAAVYQTFDGLDLYRSVEEKAANLLYFIVKNHAFVDGNKRIAAAVFLWFLEKNGILFRPDGTKRIADNALVALTLMMAESAPQEREPIVTLAANLLSLNS